jgi:hypothetical protein
VHVLNPLLLPHSLPLEGFFIKQWLDANPASFRAEVSAQSISTCEAATATPLATLLELALAHEFLLARMQAFVALPVVLARECLSTHRANKRTLVSVGTEMRAQIVGSSKALWAESALERSRMLLNALGIPIVGAHCLVVWICKSQDILSVW